MSLQPQIKNITPIQPDGSVHCYHDMRLDLRTSRTERNPDLKFFTCPLPKPDQCAFHWLKTLRKDPKWDEALFRSAYRVPLEADIEGVSLRRNETPNEIPNDTAQKRQVAEDAQPGPGLSPKRVRHDDDDIFFSSPEPPASRINDPSTPSRSGRNDRGSGWPMTPPSTLRTNRALTDVPSSPSEESARRRDLRMHGPQPLHPQNSDDDVSVTQSELSSVFGRSSSQSSTGPRFAMSPLADEVDVMLMRLMEVPDHIRKLERLQAAKQGTIDGRNSRIHNLETRLERVMLENEKLIKENERLTRENERLSRLN